MVLLVQYETNEMCIFLLITLTIVFLIIKRIYFQNKQFAFRNKNYAEAQQTPSINVICGSGRKS